MTSAEHQAAAEQLLAELKAIPPAQLRQFASEYAIKAHLAVAHAVLATITPAAAPDAAKTT